MFGSTTREVYVHISTSKCTGCGKCIERCKHGVLKLRYIDEKAYAWHAYPGNCIGCGKCAKACKQNAIEITELSGIMQESFDQII